MATYKESYEKAQRQSSLNLFQSGAYSDLTFKCGNLEKPVHKFILCEASPVIAAEVNAKWIESNTGVIEHTTYDDKTAGYMLEYMYTGDYKLDLIDMELTDEAGVALYNKNLITHIRIRGIADYYDIKNLVVLAEDRFKAGVTDNVTAAGFVTVIGALCQLVDPGSEMFAAAVEATRVNYTLLCKDGALQSQLSSNANIQPFAAAMVNAFAENYRGIMDTSMRTSFDDDEQVRVRKDMCDFANNCKLHCSLCDSRSYPTDNIPLWEVDPRELYATPGVVCGTCRMALYKSPAPPLV